MPTQMTPSAARVVDPILTSVALGYKQPKLVGSYLFPRVPVQLSGGRVIQFGKEAFTIYSSLRAPGASVKRVQLGYSGVPYALENHTLAGVVPFEIMRDASVQPGIDLGTRALAVTMNSELLELEVAQSAAAVNAANYAAANKIALAGVAKWSDPSSNPISNIDDYKETIRAGCGQYPNVALFSALAWKAFKNNPAVMDRIKYTQKGVVTTDLAASLLDIENVVVGRGVQASGAGVFSDVWGNNCVLAYCALGSLGSEEPSYGYTYTMEGHPFVEVPWMDRDAKSWIYPVSFERVPVLSGISAGFLVQTPY